MAKDLAAHVSAQPHGRAAAAPHRSDCGNDLYKSYRQHDSASVPDEVHIALCDALIDDLGV